MPSAATACVTRRPAETITPLDDLVIERFHKRALVVPPAVDAPELLDEGVARSRYLRDGKWAEGVHTDPYAEVREDGWYLHSAKKPVVAGGGHRVDGPVSAETDAAIVNTIALPAFRAIEGACARSRPSTDLLP